MIDVKNVSLSFGGVLALDGVDLTVAKGETVALVGVSGSGKSSLLYCMSGLLSPTSGSVEVAGIQLAGLSSEELAAFRRRHLGFVFQFSELVPELTLRDNIALPLELNGERGAAVRRRTDELIDALDLGERADARPARVSGGQAQRAAVARAIAHRPAVVFADEPTGALDSTNGEAVLAALLQLSHENGATVVLVTHDHTVAGRADRVVTLEDGRIEPVPQSVPL